MKEAERSARTAGCERGCRDRTGGTKLRPVARGIWFDRRTNRREVYAEGGGAYRRGKGQNLRDLRRDSRGPAVASLCPPADWRRQAL